MSALKVSIKCKELNVILVGKSSNDRNVQIFTFITCQVKYTYGKMILRYTIQYAKTFVEI